jgi:hypothetical protein
MPHRGPFYPIRSRGTGKRTKSGEPIREYFLRVPVWAVQQGFVKVGKRYEFRPDSQTGDLIYKPE